MFRMKNLMKALGLRAFFFGFLAEGVNVSLGLAVNLSLAVSLSLGVSAVANANILESKIPDVCEDYLLSPTSELRQDLIQEYAQANLTSREANEAWIERALVPGAEAFYLVMENSWLKKLNDKIFRNKDFVTALTKYHQAIFLDELRKVFGLKSFGLYSDFKSVRVSLSEVPSPLELGALRHAFVKANQRFMQDKRLQAMVRDGDLSEAWFQMGFGTTVDEASLAARAARSAPLSKGVLDFKNLAQQEKWARDIRWAKMIYGRLQRKAKLPIWDKRHLRLEVFVAARKADTLEEFQVLLREQFLDMSLKISEVKALRDMIQIADNFSPSLLVAEHETLSIEDAPFGAISLDFIGLGAENLKATLESLVQAQDTEEALRLARVNEREVTRKFEQKKAAVRKLLEKEFQEEVTVRFSGDDGIAIPQVAMSLQDQLFLLRHLGELMPEPYFRMTVIQKPKNSEVASELITHAEAIEKILRARLTRFLGPEFANSLRFNVFVTDSSLVNKVFLLVSLNRRLTEEERDVLRATFETATEIVSADVGRQNPGIEQKAYRPIEVFVMIRGPSHPRRPI